MDLSAPGLSSVGPERSDVSDDATDGGGSDWGPWALVAGVGAVGALALARELRDRRRDAAAEE